MLACSLNSKSELGRCYGFGAADAIAQEHAMLREVKSLIHTSHFCWYWFCQKFSITNKLRWGGH